MSEPDNFRRKLLITFREEADEYLVEISQGLIELEKVGFESAPNIVELVYRKVHSLKGAARAVQLKEIGMVCQDLENVLSLMKQGLFIPDAATYDTFHQTIKIINTMLSSQENPTIISKEAILAIRKLTEVKKSGEMSKYSTTATHSTRKAIPPLHTRIPEGKTDTIREIRAMRGGDLSKAIFSSKGSSGLMQAGEMTPPLSSRIDPESTVRIASSKLDRLIAGSDELLTTRLFITHRSDELEDMMTRFSFWRWNRTLVSSDLHHIRKYTRDINQSVLPPDLVLPLQRVVESLKFDHEFITNIQHALSAHIRATERDNTALETITTGISELIHDVVVLQAFSTFLMPFSGFVREYSREIGKEVDLVIEGGEIEMDRRILNTLKAPIFHLINNCVGHGIEYPDIRSARKKPVRGIIRIRVIPLSGSMVRIEVTDDGNGIECSAIRQAAVRSGNITQREVDKLTDDEVIWLIFRSGLSLNSSVTDLSGRGLGLAIVEEAIARLGGKVSVSSTPGVGTTLTMWVPIRLVTLRGVIIRSGNQSYVIPMKQVSQVIRVRPDAITSLENRSIITVQEEKINVIHLTDALQMPMSRIHNDGTGYIPIVIVAYAAGKIACIVDQVVRVQEIVVRPLGSQLRRVKQITGAVILGDGTVALVIDPLELIQDALATHRLTPVTPESLPKKFRVLVVEDSVTSRTLLRDLLEKEGCDVITALDGVEAFAILKEHEFDMVVSDVDMPRMSGFTLTEKIRSDPNLAKMPVVLVTSLESPEDERHGYTVGADAYVIKSDFEQREFISVIQRFLLSDGQ